MSFMKAEAAPEPKVPTLCDEERSACERAEEEERRRQQEAEDAERRRLEEEWRAEEERVRLEEEAARRKQEDEERARLEREEQARRKEAERQVLLKEERERKEALEGFCRQNGFAGITAPRRSGCTLWSATTTYPLHFAAEVADTRVVEMLLKEGVNREQKNSAGKTAADIARKKDKSGSHADVRRLLRGAAVPRSGGA